MVKWFLVDPKRRDQTAAPDVQSNRRPRSKSTGSIRKSPARLRSTQEPLSPPAHWSMKALRPPHLRVVKVQPQTDGSFLLGLKDGTSAYAAPVDLDFELHTRGEPTLPVLIAIVKRYARHAASVWKEHPGQASLGLVLRARSEVIRQIKTSPDNLNSLEFVVPLTSDGVKRQLSVQVALFPKARLAAEKALPRGPFGTKQLGKDLQSLHRPGGV